ncbi:MAG: glycosyltransferase, partial [Candidatus Kryptoniota bacterium]
QARKQLGLPVDVPIMLFFGIVREYKGLRDILYAMPAIKARLGKAILLIAGEFWEDKRLYLRIIESLGIGDSIVIEDRYIPNEEIPLYFSAADVLVAPYRHVTSSAVLKTAQGFGIPIITTASRDSLEYAEGIFLTDSTSLADAVVYYFEICTSRCSSYQSDPQLSQIRLVDALEQ